MERDGAIPPRRAAVEDGASPAVDPRWTGPDRRNGGRRRGRGCHPAGHPPPLAGPVAIWSVPFLVGGPMVSLDVQSYAAIGRLATLGLDPYQDTPGLLSDRFGAGVDPLWRWTPTPYGPLQVQLLHGLAALAGNHV